jgi:hypothetical protein
VNFIYLGETMKTEAFGSTNELGIGSEAVVTSRLDLNIQTDWVTPASYGRPDQLIASNSMSQPADQTATHIANKPHKRKFYDYMHLNPIVLKTIEEVAGTKFILPPHASEGVFPELNEYEAHDVLCFLRGRIPRQPDCAIKARFETVSSQYCAGVIDGEAHVSTVMYQHKNRQHPGFRLLTSISQNHYEMLQAVQNSLGANGAIYSVTRRIGQNRQCYDLKYNGIHALAALSQVYPYLIRKKSLALMMIKMYADCRIWEHVGARGVHPVILDRRVKLHAKIKRMD